VLKIITVTAPVHYSNVSKSVPESVSTKQNHHKTICQQSELCNGHTTRYDEYIKTCISRSKLVRRHNITSTITKAIICTMHAAATMQILSGSFKCSNLP